MTEYYCVGQCHQGTDIAVFRSGPSDEKLTLEEAKRFANEHGRGHYFFDCEVGRAKLSRNWAAFGSPFFVPGRELVGSGQVGVGSGQVGVGSGQVAARLPPGAGAR